MRSRPGAVVDRSNVQYLKGLYIQPYRPEMTNLSKMIDRYSPTAVLRRLLPWNWQPKTLKS